MKYNFIKDIEEGFKKYPLLNWSGIKANRLVEGIFIAHDSSLEIEEYEVRISFPKAYPYELPIVIETSNKIQPRNATRHIFVEGNLCFGNKQDVLRLCRDGINFIWFLDKILNPHLCREYIKDKTGYYPTGERGHGTDGTWEGYYEVFGTIKKAVILRELNLVLTYPFFAKNKECYCGSEKKYKRCHEKRLPLIFDIGRNNVRKLYNELVEDFQKKGK